MLPEIATIPLQSAAPFDAPLAAELFLIARVVFGGVLAFTGINHFLDLEGTAGYAEMKGVPLPKLSVLGSGVLLVFGGLGVAVGALPAIAAGALALFLLVATPMMHDFWAVPEDQQESEMNSFLKNAGLFAAAIGFLALASIEWPYALGVSVF